MWLMYVHTYEFNLNFYFQVQLSKSLLALAYMSCIEWRTGKSNVLLFSISISSLVNPVNIVSFNQALLHSSSESYEVLHTQTQITCVLNQVEETLFSPYNLSRKVWVNLLFMTSYYFCQILVVKKRWCDHHYHHKTILF